jgi:hypothetical protein
MYAPLALKSVYGKRVSSSMHRLTFSQSTRPNSQSHNNWDTAFQWDTVKTTQTRGFRGCYRWRSGWRCGFTRVWDHCAGSTPSTETKSWTHICWFFVFQRIHKPGHAGHGDAIQPNNVDIHRGSTACGRSSDGYFPTVVLQPVFPRGLTTVVATCGICSRWFVGKGACAAPLKQITFPAYGQTGIVSPLNSHNRQGCTWGCGVFAHVFIRSSETSIGKQHFKA